MKALCVWRCLSWTLSLISEPVFYFQESEYMVDESAGELEVKVWKTGTDLSRPSSVTVRSRQLKPVSAECK